jgi:hypothetical protein
LSDFRRTSSDRRFRKLRCRTGASALSQES